MHQFTATREGILQLLKQALEENQPKEIIERLQWFLHFTEYGSVSGTCRRFRIARSTFYRWQRRFDPNDLSTIADLPPSQGTAIFQGVPAFCRVQQSLAHTVAMTKETSAPASHKCPFCRFWSWIQPLWKRCGRLTVLLSIFLNLALILFMLLPGSAGASSWSPTLLVNTESFQIIDDSDANADIYIQFGDSLSKKLTFERTLDRFNFNDDVYIGGNLGVSGTTSGATVHAQNTLTSSGTLTVNGNAEIRGTLSGANLTVMAGADSYLMGNVGIGTTVPGAKLDARGSAVFNEDSADADFRVEGNNNANLIFADAGNDYVGIGTVPQSHLHVYGSNVEHRIEASNANGDASISLFSDVDWKIINHGVGSAATVDSLIFWNDTAGAVRFVVDPTGSVGIGDTTPSTKLDVAGGISGTTLKITGHTTLGNTVTIRGVAYTFPASDGSASGKVLKTDGSGNLSWSADTGGSSGVSQDDADARYVNVSGDTMTGALSIKKTSGTATGNTLVVDTKGLVYDATNKRVGIGDVTPSNELEVRGTASGTSLHAHSLLTSSGNVLAAGNITVNSDNGAADAILTFGNDAAAETLRFNDTTNGFVFSDDVEVQGTLSGANLTVMAGGDSYLMGNVGIGTTSPDALFDVSDQFEVNNDGVVQWGTTTINYGFLSWDTNLAIMGGFTDSDLALYANGEKVRIKTDGNVGIGTTSPTTKLEVVGTMSGSALAIHTNQTSKTGALLLNQDGNGTGMLLDSEATNAPGIAIDMPTQNAANNPHLLFGYNGAFDTKLYRSAANTLTPSGHFVPSAHNTFNLGTTSVRWANVYSGPGSFHVGVEGNEARIGFNEEFSELEFDSDGNNTAEVIVDKQGRMGIGARPLTDTLEVEGSAAKSSPGGWRGRSDIRIKKDVQTIENSLDAINALRPVQYRFKPEYLAEHPLIKDTVYYNYIAQEFRNVFPDSVFEDATGYLQIDSYAVNPYLVGSVQELSARVQALEKRMVSAEDAGSVLTISGGTIEITAGYHLVAMQDGKKNDVLAHIRGGVLGQVLVLQPKDKQKITLRMSGHLLLEEDFQMHNPGDIIVLLKIDDDRWVELTRSKSSGTKLVDIFSGWEQGAFETVDEGM